MKKKKSVRPVAVRVANGTVKVAGVLFIVSCSGQPTGSDESVYPSYWQRAQASPNDASTDSSVDTSADTTTNTPADQASEPVTTVDPPMPPNPTHVSFRFAKVPGEVILSQNSGAAFPYPSHIADEGDHQVLTLYLPQMQEGENGIGVQVTQLSAHLEPVGKPLEFTVEPQAKLGTVDIEFGATSGAINIGPDAQHTLVLGENIMDGKVTSQFIDGAMRTVMQGIFTAPASGAYRIEFEGDGKAYAFLDAPPEAHEEAFEVSLKAGQVLALWVPVEFSTDAVTVQVTPVEPACTPPPEE